jgi:hypothetical protein
MKLSDVLEQFPGGRAVQSYVCAAEVEVEVAPDVPGLAELLAAVSAWKRESTPTVYHVDGVPVELRHQFYTGRSGYASWQGCWIAGQDWIASGPHELPAAWQKKNRIVARLEWDAGPLDGDGWELV